jgi:dUTP pyrophosphatase
MRKFELIKEEFRNYQNINLPKRATKGSAGYDFESPTYFELKPQEKIVIFTDVKAYMEDDKVLLLFIRSSIGTKKDLILTNGTGVIDSSYADNKQNDGNIGVPLKNIGNEIIKIEKGERIAQGMFTNYFITDDDNVEDERIGGFREYK